MNTSTRIMLLGMFFISIMVPTKSLADLLPSDDAALKHEEYKLCGDYCEFSCATRYLPYLPCRKDCKTGFFCINGYIRKYMDGPCILPSECPE